MYNIKIKIIKSFKHAIVKYTILLLIVGAILNCKAQEKNLNYKIFNSNNGLSENNVYTLFAHQNGLIYIGTSCMLNVLDGENIIEIKTLSNQAIRSIIPYKKDSLILLKENAICIINIHNYGYREKDFSDENFNVMNKGILVGNIVYASSEDGLAAINLSNFSYQLVSKNLKDPQNESMQTQQPSICYSAQSQNIYVGCRKGFIIYNLITKKAINRGSDTLTKNLILQHKQTAYNCKYLNGNIYFKTHGKMVMRFNEKNNSLVETKYQRFMLKDFRQEEILHRIYTKDTNNYEYKSLKELNAKYAINAIYEKNDEVYFCTQKGLIVKSNKLNSLKIDTVSQLNNGEVLTQTYFSVKNFLYFNFKTCILEFDTLTGKKVFYEIPKEKIKLINCITLYKKNILCIGGQFGYIGFDLIKKKFIELHFFSKDFESKIKKTNIIAINYDSITNHIILCPFRNSIFYKDLNSNQEFTWNGSDSGWYRTMRSLFYLGNYDYYFGGHGSNGLLKYNFKTHKSKYYSPNKFSKIGAARIAINQIKMFQNNLFLATNNGLIKLNTNTNQLIKITAEKKVYNDIVYTLNIINDRLYVASSNNLFIYLENNDLFKICEFENVLNSGIPYKFTTNIELFFGNQILRKSIPNTNYTAKISLSHIKSGNYWHNVNNKNLLHLPYSQNQLTFTFGTNSVIKNEIPIQLFYKFSINDSWQLVKNYIINLNNLSYGKHKLMYYSNQWGVNNEVQYFIINIDRPWWASYWLYSMIAFVSIALTFFSIRYFYTNKIKKQKKEMALTIHSIEAERKRISRDLHDGIGPKLSSIKLIGETIRYNTNNNLVEQLPNIIDETIVDIRYIINELSPHTLKQNGLFEALNSFINITSKRNFLEITFTSNSKEINVNEEIAINLFRIGQESINNAIKYAECSNISMDLIYLDQISIELTIKDNGKGFNYDEALKKGSGISNMLTRCDLMNGEFKINSEKGNGTELKIFVSLFV